MTDHDAALLTSRKYFDQRLGSLKQEFQSFETHYKELSQFVQPRRGRFLTNDRNKGDKRYSSIINSRATQAQRTARAGLFAGTMSPTRPWFALVTPDPLLMEFQPVRIWLDDRERTIRAILNQSNFYNMAPVMLGELLLFATGCMLHVDDYQDVARFYTQTVGSYYIAQNERFEVNTLVRQFQRNTEQLIKQFGLVNVSTRVRDAYDKGNYDLWHDVVHFIEPNPDEDNSKLESRFKPFRSVHYQPDNTDKNKFLGFSGFDEFPAYCPRWDVTNEDVYGTDCPGMTSLGDVKGLQIEEKRKAQGIDKMVNPPLRGPAALRNVPISSLPGGATLYDTPNQNNQLAPIYQVNPQLNELMLDIQQVEARIDKAYFVDLFNAISNMEGIQPRNQEELLQRNQERLLQLGPVLERVHGEFLSKMIDRIFNQMVRADLVPPAPPELQGQELEIKFISSLAMAQKAVAVQGIERLAGFVGSLAEMSPSAIDKFDADQAIDEYANAIGVPPKILVPDEELASIREAKARQQQMQMALQAAKDAGPLAGSLAGTAVDAQKVFNEGPEGGGGGT